IGNRTAFLAHTRLAERTVCFERPIIFAALDHISTRRGRWCDITLVGLRGVELLAIVARCGTITTYRLGTDRHGYDRCQASGRENHARRPLRHHHSCLL